MKLLINKRIDEIKRLILCFNCLRGNHFYNSCRSDGFRTYKAKRNTLICNSSRDSGQRRVNDNVEHSNRSSSSVAKNEGDVENIQNSLASVGGNPASPTEVLLSTAVILIKNRYDKFVKCRALLDSTSQMSLIRKELVDRLGSQNMFVCR